MRVDFLLLTCLLGFTPLAAQESSFRVSANYVKVPVSAFDETGQLVRDLTPDDFQLLDDGQPRQIENFVVDFAPIHVLLLLDVSGSMEEEIEEIKTAAFRFAGSFSKEDLISIMSFSDEVLLLQDWTNKIKRIKKALKKLKPGYRTALYDALASTVSEHFQGIPGRRVIIVLTDGLDNQSTVAHGTLLSQLIRSDITLYIVSRTRLVLPKVSDSVRVEFLNRVMKRLLKDEGDFVEIYFREKEAAMRQLAENTGGRALFPQYLEELADSYVAVARELKQQYVLTFRPPDDAESRFRTIELFCNQPLGRLHYRRQYMWP